MPGRGGARVSTWSSGCPAVAPLEKRPRAPENLIQRSSFKSCRDTGPHADLFVPIGP